MYLHAALLGIVQGLTEFLPVSSSARLIPVRMFFGWGLAGTVPIVIAGLLGAAAVEAHTLRTPLMMVAALVAGPIAMLVAERLGAKRRDRQSLPRAEAFLIGAAGVAVRQVKFSRVGSAS